MKKIITVIALLLSSLSLRASTFNITAGASTATIQSTINSAAAASGGNIVQFAAGSYSITSQINIPCPASALTIQGPIPGGITFSGTNARPSIWPITPAATLTNNGITNNWGFQGNGCNTATIIQYLEWNGNQPSGGGGGLIHIPLGMNNVTIQYNYIHGNMAIQTTQQRPDTHVYLDGGYSSTHTQNTLIRWNRFGSTGSGDCGGNATAATGKGIMSLMGSGGGNGTCYSTSPSGYAPPSGASNSVHSCLYQGQANNNAGGGSCAAFGLAVNTDNFSFLNNSVQEQEQAGKCFKNNSGNVTSTNTLLQFNDISGIHRIGYEAQCNDGLTTVDSNDFHDPFQPDANSWSLSVPQGNTASTNNVIIANTTPINDRNGNPPSGAGNGIEFWGPLTSSNNLIQGKFNGGILFGFHTGSPSINNNIFQMTDSTQYIVNEEGATPPSQSGNITGQTLSARVSVAPTISPTNGTAPLTITLTDSGYTSGAGPQGNTGIWYTIDGSNPIPGSGTAKYLSSGQTFLLVSAATVKAVGMWGAINQPTSYPTNYGFVPSSIISAIFTGGGGGPTLVSITLSSTGGITTFTPGQTNQLIATGHFSDGSASDISSTSNFISSTPGVGSVTSVGGFYTAGSTAGTTNISASQGAISTTTPLVLTTGTITPTLTNGSLSQAGNINTIAIGGGTVPFVANGVYSDSIPRTLPDSFGNTANWTIVPGSSTCGTVNSSGVFTPTTIGTCNVKVISSPGGVNFSPWTMTVTASVITLTSITLGSAGGVTSITVGATVQLIATGHYSDGSTANITGSINSWATSDGTKATITSGGLVTGVAAGSPTFTATMGTVTSTPAFPLTVITGITLQSIVITAPGGANTMLLNWTLPFDAHCLYSNGDNFDCVTTDGHGNAVTWLSSNTLAATFTNNILKEISATHGNGFVTASAASVTSAQYPMTYNPVGPLMFSLTGINITFTGSSIGISYR